MKKYIGTKEVQAEPMSLGEFIQLTGRNPYMNSTVSHDNSEEGYIVEYSDGYKSWSPKQTFENAYKLNESVLDRLIVERNELVERCSKCDAFIQSDQFRNIVPSDYQAFLLTLQRKLMQDYIQVLVCRMNMIADPEEFSSIKRMSFGIAIEALQAGFAIRRAGWNGKGLWVIKQIPAHIDKEIIPKMSSLPQSAKKLILDGIGYINYTSQCLIYNEATGRADSWVPSISDVFAEDWEIVCGVDMM